MVVSRSIAIPCSALPSNTNLWQAYRISYGNTAFQMVGAGGTERQPSLTQTLLQLRCRHQNIFQHYNNVQLQPIHQRSHVIRNIEESLAGEEGESWLLLARTEYESTLLPSRCVIVRILSVYVLE
jgi:hypothetical protein